MIASIVGNYLKQKSWITDEQYHDLMLEHRKIRVQLGLIAIAEGLMTAQETERVNRLQATMDMRFGDIAVKEGYLTEGQLEGLLKKQGNPYLAFAQALENQQLMKVDQLEQILVDFQYDHNLTVSDMEALKSDDVDRILALFLPLEGAKYRPLASVAVKTLMRLVDKEMYIEKGYLAKQRDAQNGALQTVEGKQSFSSGLIGRGNALLPAASVFGQEKFTAVDEDALDSIGELVNCINGLISTDLSETWGSLELCPPVYSTEMTAVGSDELLVLPMNLLGKKVDLVISLDSEIKTIQEN
jgi:CheY-specific phosphatase CheX